jgi:hypothetical protein
MDFESLKYIVPAATGLIGVIVGSMFSLIGKRKETRLRIIEKVFDKRLKAHEDILDLAKQMRTTVSTNNASDGLNIDSYPGILHNKEYFNQFKGNFFVVVNLNSHWISIELFRQLNYFQDYMENVSQTLLKLDEANYPNFGVIVKQDFIDLAAELETETLKFFEKDLYNVNLKTTKGHHKWPKEYTLSRLNNTELIKKHELILKIR